MLIKMKVFNVLPEGACIPNRYMRIPLLPKFIFKADGCHKCRIVAGGHVTGDLTHKVYLSHVKAKNVRILFIIACKEGLKLLMGNVTNA